MRTSIRDIQGIPIASAAMIDPEQVRRIANILRETFGGKVPQQATWDDPHFWNVEASREQRCQFLAVGNAINFRFWSVVDGQVLPSTGDIRGTSYRGSMYLWRRLRMGITRGDFSLDPDFLRSLTSKQFQQAFRDDNGHFPLAPGLDDRIANLVDIGTTLITNWGGQFANVVDAAGGSLERFATLSGTFRAFDDPIQKLTMVNAIMLTGSGLTNFDRHPRPGIDYHLVKQAVRQGLVRPPASTCTKLANGQLLGPEESLALRGATLEALVRVSDQAGISTAVVDNLYWLNRRVCDEAHPACQRDGAPTCPFESSCRQLTGLGLPLELTRYY